MDGNTTPITIAADLAARKGFLVVNSAGNSVGMTLGNMLLRQPMEIVFWR